MADLEMLMSQELFLQEEELDDDFFDDPEVIEGMSNIDLDSFGKDVDINVEKKSSTDVEVEGENVPLPPEKDYQFSQSNGIVVQFKYSEDYEFLNLDSKSDLDKLFLCVSATVVPRRVWISHQIHHLISNLTLDEAVAYVFPLILKLCNDSVLSVREAISKNLALILPIYFQEGMDKGIDTESFFSLLNSALFSTETSVADAASDSIVSFLLQVDIEILQVKLLPVIVQLLLAPESIKHLIPKDNILIRLRTLKVLKSVVARLCQQTLDEVLLPIVENLYSEPNFEIRIEIIRLITSLIPKLSLKTIENRLWLSLAELIDDKIYQVRLECISSLLLLFENHTKSSILGTWIHTVNKLSEDRSAKVKQEIQANLGRIIYFSFGSKEVENLLKKYWAACHTNQVDVRVGCAKTLPAVINRFGKTHWAHIQPALEKFINDKEIEVVLPIAASFHHLPEFIEPRIIKSNYIGLLKSFLSNADRDAQIVLILNTHQLLASLPIDYVPTLLPNLIEFMSDLLFLKPPTSFGDRWSYHVPLLHQIRETLSQFPTTSVVADLLSKLMRIVKGEYPHFIKLEVVTTIVLLYRQATDPSCSMGSLSVLLMDQVVALIEAKSYRLRCLFVTLCRSILLPDLYSEFGDADDRLLIPNLGKLCNDPTVEVRLLVAKLLKDIYTIEIVEALNRSNTISPTDNKAKSTSVQPTVLELEEPETKLETIDGQESSADATPEPLNDNKLSKGDPLTNSTTSVRYQLLIDLKSKFLNEANPDILILLNAITIP